MPRVEVIQNTQTDAPGFADRRPPAPRPYLTNEVRPYWEISEYWVTLDGEALWLHEIELEHLVNLLTLLRMHAAQNRFKAVIQLGGKRTRRGFVDADGHLLNKTWQGSALEWIEATPLHAALMAELEAREAAIRQQQLIAQRQQEMQLISSMPSFPMQLELGL